MLRGILRKGETKQAFVQPSFAPQPEQTGEFIDPKLIIEERRFLFAFNEQIQKLIELMEKPTQEALKQVMVVSGMVTDRVLGGRPFMEEEK